MLVHRLPVRQVVALGVVHVAGVDHGDGKAAGCADEGAGVADDLVETLQGKPSSCCRSITRSALVQVMVNHSGTVPLAPSQEAP